MNPRHLERKWRQIIVLVAFAVGLTARSLNAAAGLTLSWQTNVLKVAGGELPGSPIEIWWLEAFCRKGSTHRPWNLTTIQHRTELLSADPSGKRLKLISHVGAGVEALEELQARRDEVEFRVTLRNTTAESVDLEWFEPCIHVGRFTGRNQTNYISKCFIFTENGLTRLDELPRNESALYHGGQVYVPKGIDVNDVNPRPISVVTPANGLIGCFSADDQYLLATAWERTQHLFQGVIVCIHSDPHVGGLKAYETKQLRGKIYLMKNDPAALLKRYRHDFPDGK